MPATPCSWGLRNDAAGIHSLNRLDNSDLVRVLVTEQKFVAPKNRRCTISAKR